MFLIYFRLFVRLLPAYGPHFERIIQIVPIGGGLNWLNFEAAENEQKTLWVKGPGQEK